MLLDTSKRSSPSQDIYVKDINGRAKVQKTFHSAEDSFPAVSPDGQKLAFCSRRNGNWDVFITTLDSGRAVRQVTFTEADEIAPSWSRDGERLAYCKQSQSTDDWEIWITDLTQGSWTSLAPGLFPRFSSSHGLLTFQRTDSSGYSSIWTIDELGKRETQVISSAEESFITPSWSPDGQKIVFASIGKAFAPRQAWKRSRPDDVETLRAADLWTIDADGNNLTQLTGHEADDWAPVWGADGRVYFSSSRDGQTNIWSAIPEFVDIRPASLDTSVDD